MVLLFINAKVFDRISMTVEADIAVGADIACDNLLIAFSLRIN